MAKKGIPTTRATAPASRWMPGLALIGILLTTFLVYLPSLDSGFTNWDDDTYVTANPLVAHPRLPDLLITPVSGNYHPLTMLSLALDYRLSGDQPAPYHRFNLLLHLANTALVFGFVWALSRRRFWAATATSLFFGIHPMHVESVAWITERKDVLYTFFYLLGLVAYLRYLANRRWTWLAACLAAFVLSLASKPAAVVFPLTLLALDWFFQRTDRARLVLEKLPFLALSAAVGWLTFSAQIPLTNATPVGPWSPLERLLFASYGIVMYVLKLFVPVGLSALYPYPPRGTHLGPEFYGALGILAVGLPALLYACRRLRPVWFGLAFFFINIVLVLQLVTIGQAVMADRYTYVPYIGLLLGLTWWLDEPPRPVRAASRARLAIAAVLVVLLPWSLYQTRARCRVWSSAETLWTDIVRRSPHPIDFAYNNLGNALAAEGRLDEAIPRFREAIRLRNDYFPARLNLGAALAAQGKLDEAILQYREAIRIDSSSMAPHLNLGAALATQARFDEAIAEYREAIRLAPGNGTARMNLGLALAAQGRLGEAVSELRGALELDPDNPEAERALALTLQRADSAHAGASGATGGRIGAK